MDRDIDQKLRGLVAFAVTPVANGGEVDEIRLRRLLDTLIEAGVDGVTVLGSSGALGSFSEAERMRIAEVAVRHVARRAAVTVGTGAITTAETVRLSQHAEQIGADAILVVPINYWPPTEAEIEEHYAATAGSVRIPLCVYNNPRLSGVDLQPALIARIARIGNVRYLKESSPDPGRIAEVRRLVPTMVVSAGRDAQLLEALGRGAQGWHSAIANVLPHQCVRLFRFVRGGDMAAASELFQRILPLTNFAVSQGLVRSLHTAFDILGEPVGHPRPPLRLLAGAERDELIRLLNEVGLLSAKESGSPSQLFSTGARQ